MKNYVKFLLEEYYKLLLLPKFPLQGKLVFYEIQSIVKDIICKKKLFTKKNDIFTIW